MSPLRQCPGTLEDKCCNLFLPNILKIFIPLVLYVMDNVVHSSTSVMSVKSGMKSTEINMINLRMALQQRRKKMRKKMKGKSYASFSRFIETHRVATSSLVQGSDVDFLNEFRLFVEKSSL